MAGFIDVLLRGLALSGQAVAIGGVLFALCVLRPAVRTRRALLPLYARSWRLIALGAGAAAVAQALSLAIQIHQLRDEGGWPVREILGTGYFEASLIRVGACLGLIVAASALRGDVGRRAWWTLVGLSTVLGIGSALTSHAASRVDHRGILLALDGLHQVD